MIELKMLQTLSWACDNKKILNMIQSIIFKLDTFEIKISIDNFNSILGQNIFFYDCYQIYFTNK